MISSHSLLKCPGITITPSDVSRLHRVACLRDDIVFFVYLYQKWIYPEDKRRRNEFGQVGEDEIVGEGGDDEEDVEEKLLAELETKKDK
jgi:hypothetical protein